MFAEDNGTFAVLQRKTFFTRSYLNYATVEKKTVYAAYIPTAALYLVYPPNGNYKMYFTFISNA